jgi:hypothetical protein
LALWNGVPVNAGPRLTFVTTDIGVLISRLDDPRTDIAEDAKYALISRATDVIPELARALPGLGRFGKLSAIEVFEAYGDRRAGPALIGLLTDADTAVREWAANALGALRYAEAGPALAKLYTRLLRDLVRPDFTEPVAVRTAMRSLGIRRRVTPDLTRTLARDIGGWLKWPVALLPKILRDLADHDQVVLYFMLWRVGQDSQLSWTQHERVGWTFDYLRPWAENVTGARDAALLEVRSLQDTGNLVASIEWIDQRDITIPLPGSGQECRDARTQKPCPLARRRAVLGAGHLGLNLVPLSPQPPSPRPQTHLPQPRTAQRPLTALRPAAIPRCRCCHRCSIQHSPSGGKDTMLLSPCFSRTGTR